MKSIILDTDELLKRNDYRDYLAPKWKRLVNFLIDYFLVLLIWLLVVRLIWSYLYRPESRVSDIVIIFLLIAPFISVSVLYFVCEKYMGKTLGKLITGTKVISVFDEPLTSRQIVLRTLSRIAPFEPLSLFFANTAWHDDWSDTAVVNKNYEANLV